jgi:uncharacterized protein YjiS (DUF1127 family)
MSARIITFPTDHAATDASATRKVGTRRRLRIWGAKLSLHWINLLDTAWLCAARWRQRRALEELDPRLLRDIGVTRTEANREARMPFWRP